MKKLKIQNDIVWNIQPNNSQLLNSSLSSQLSSTRKMAATMFKRMQESNLPEHLVDHIANQVHRIFSKDVFQEIHTMYSPFEKFFVENGENVFDILKQLYPDMTVHVDMFFEWITVVLKLTATKFVVWHHFNDDYVNEVILMEGEVKENENVYIFNKFLYVDEGRQPETFHDVEKYHQKQCKNMMPFQFLHYSMKNEHCMQYNVYKKAENYGKWLMHKKISNAFDFYPWHYEEPIFE